MFQKFLSFDEMVTPLIIKIIYWIGIVASVVSGLVSIIQGINSYYGGGAMVIGGLLMIILGPIFTRVWCELMIVMFKIYENLVELNSKIKRDETPLQ